MVARRASTERSDKIARRVRLLRHARGWTAQHLADLLAAQGTPLSRTSLAELENRKRQHVTVDELFAFAEVFQAPVDVLLDSGPVCRTCNDAPPPSMACLNCGATGTDQARTDTTRRVSDGPK